jgi:cardiolipin synthase
VGAGDGDGNADPGVPLAPAHPPAARRGPASQGNGGGGRERDPLLILPTEAPAGIRVALSAAEAIELLDGGDEAYPRMLAAISGAMRSIHLEVYAFSFAGVGARFVEALARAAQRGVKVGVIIDGWGSARGGRAVAAALRTAGCKVEVYNRLRALLLGRFGRNHRKLLLIDEEIAFLGGINIGDQNVMGLGRPVGADLALEIRGPQCALLARMIRREPRPALSTSLRINLSRLGGGWRLRRRYLKAIARARRRVLIAHGYFLPDHGIVRAITAAARRGVQVHLLLAGRSDVPLAHLATQSLHRRLLAAGVRIHEWSQSVLHAKVATVDGALLLIGSFNLDPFSLANLGVLVEVADTRVVAQAERWIETHFARSPPASLTQPSSRMQGWLLDRLGFLLVRLASAAGRLLGVQARSRARHSYTARARRGSPSESS